MESRAAKGKVVMAGPFVAGTENQDTELGKQATFMKNMKNTKNMKAKSAALLAAAAMAMSCSATHGGADTNAAPERIGVYDSRIVAYAHFVSEAQQRKLNEEIKAARDAQAAGQTNQFQELSAVLKKKQDQIHLQGFSTAPIEDVLTEIRDQLPAIEKEAGVSKLICKWDKEALKLHPKAEQVDVTDALARLFKPNAEHLKVMDQLKRSKPVPLDQMK